MTALTVQIAPRARDYISVNGPEALSYLNRMVSNEVEALAVGEACDALLLTAKARLVAPLVVLRRAEDKVLLLTEPGLGEVVKKALLRSRLGRSARSSTEVHTSLVVLGVDQGGIPCRDFGLPAIELIDSEPPGGAEALEPDELERLRILAGTPRWGHELDDRVLPAEAGLEEHAISFTKGCYPGQEPVARLHHRGHPNRTLRVLEIPGGEPPALDTTLELDGKAVGRITSAAADLHRGVVALAYVRREVPGDAALTLSDGREARPLSA